MNDSSGVLLAIVLSVLVGLVAGLTAGILGWIKDSSLPVTERSSGAILRGGAACAATILLVLAVLTAIGALR
jgi:hypothetical protein